MSILRFVAFCLPWVKYKVYEESMLPLYKPGDLVLVNKFSYLFRNPRVGDVIVFKNNSNLLIKEIVKVRGQIYFVIGKNTIKSIDSHMFGWIPKTVIVGKVIGSVQ